MNLKNLFLAIILSLLAGGGTVLAAGSVSFSPASIEKNTGQSFSTDVNLNLSSAVYTVKIEVNYPADILKVDSFNFGEKWFVLPSQPGYDLIDNANGLLIKTAGYPGGVSGTVKLGTIFFSAKKDGDGLIKLINNSLLLNADNTNVFDNVLSEVSVKITAVEQPVSGGEVISGGTVSGTSEPTEEPESAGLTGEEETLVSSDQPAETEGQEIGFLTAAGVFLTFGTGKIWLGILIWGLAVVILILLFIFNLRKK